MLLTEEERIGLLQSAVESTDNDGELVEKVLEAACMDGRCELSAKESQFVAKLTGWSPAEIRKNQSRVSRKLRLLAIAGSAADRAAAAKRADEDAELLESEGNRIADEIAKLQRQLESLQRAAKLSSQRVEEHRKAVADLRECLPPFVVEQIDEKSNAVKRGARKQLHELEDRRREILVLLDEEAEGHIDHLRRKYPECTSLVKNSAWLKYQLNESWTTKNQELVQELAQLDLTIPVLEAEVAEAFAEVERLKDFNILEVAE